MDMSFRGVVKYTHHMDMSGRVVKFTHCMDMSFRRAAKTITDRVFLFTSVQKLFFFLPKLQTNYFDHHLNIGKK